MMARSEALVAFTNPKLILIFYAFFPQFINPREPVAPQIAVMGSTFLLIEVAAIGLYAFGGRWLQTRLEDGRSSKWLSRFTAAALSAAADDTDPMKTRLRLRNATDDTGVLVLT